MPPSLDRPFDRPGLFVTLEGGEGTGKSTQLERLRRRLAGAGREVVATREPGGTERAEAIRAMLLSGAAKPHGVLAEALLFAAARLDHVQRLIRPALANGAVVLCDRYTDSSQVYQGALGGVPDVVLAALERAVGLRPHLTLLLDLPASVGLARARARQAGPEGPDRFEGEGEVFHARVREAFLSLAAGEPDRIAVVDARGSFDEVEAHVWAALRPRLGTTGDGHGE